MDTNTNISCGWFNVETGESGSFVSKQEQADYDSAPWYKKLFKSKPFPKVTQSNPYSPPEFYKSFDYTQNWIESSLFRRANTFQTHGVLNIYIERNKYSESHSRFFYEDEGSRVYLDPKALIQGKLVKLLV